MSTWINRDAPGDFHHTATRVNFAPPEAGGHTVINDDQPRPRPTAIQVTQLEDAFADIVTRAPRMQTKYREASRPTRSRRGEQEHSGPRNRPVGINYRAVDYLEEDAFDLKAFCEGCRTMLPAGIAVEAHLTDATVAVATASKWWSRVLLKVPFLPKRWGVERVSLLHGLRAVIPSSSMVLVLGPPGSGKTTLLRFLAGRLHANRAYDVSGLSWSTPVDSAVEFSLSEGTDAHLPRLTVKETLEFAMSCRSSLHSARFKKFNPQYQSADSKRFYNFFVLLILKILDLLAQHGTLVGDGGVTLRGISGGQMRRVTLGEMWASSMRAVIADELSTGLDSYTTFDICQSLRVLCEVQGITAVVSLLQPSPELFNLFSHVMILAKGEIMYYGPPSEAQSWFEVHSGTKKNPLQDLTDYVLSFTGEEHYRRFVAAYRAHAENPHPLPYTSPIPEKSGLFSSRTVRGFPTQGRLVIRRQALLEWRNKSFLLLNTVILHVINGLFTGTLFWMTKDNQEGTTMRLGLFLLSIFTLMSHAIPHSALMIKERPIFYKQRDARFFTCGMYAIGWALLQFPRALVETMIFGIITYWLSGLSRTFLQWLSWQVTLFLFYYCNVIQFRWIGAISPTMEVAQNLGGFIQVLWVVVLGFLIYTANIPYFWYGIQWICPPWHCYRCLALNQFIDNVIDCSDFSKLKMNACLYPSGTVTLNSLYSPYENTYGDIFWSYFALIGLTVVNLVILTFALSYCTYRPPRSASGVALKLEEAPAVCAPAGTLHVHDRNTACVRLDAPEASGSLLDHAPRSALTVRDISYFIWVPVDKSVPVMDPTEDRSPPPVPCEVPRTRRHCFKHQVEKQLLCHISGVFPPGTMTALMGPSGAGKTTFLDVIAGRKTIGRVEGTVLLNGRAVSKAEFSRSCGYVEQSIALLGRLTVRETVEFSANLRLPSSFSKEEKASCVNDVLELLDLMPLSLLHVKTLSLEQKKRLMVAVEYVSNSPILFLDEPTSGLDNHGAQIVIRVLRRVCNAGRTVICTIHQPSSEIFFSFDRIVLLRVGGSVVYSGNLGHAGCNMVSYLERTCEEAKADVDRNPADWMLQVMAEKDGCCVNLQQAWLQSPEYEAALVILAQFESEEYWDSMAHTHDNELCRRSDPRFAPKHRGGYANGFLSQLVRCSQRTLRIYWRSPGYSVVRVILTILLGLLFGLVFLDLGHSNSDISSRSGFIYGAPFYIGIAAMTAVVSLVMDERPVYVRERALRMYGTVPYVFALQLAELPFQLVYATIFSLIAYFIAQMELDAWRFFVFYMMFFIINVNIVYFGHLISAFATTAEVAQSMAPGISSWLASFSGFPIPGSLINPVYSWVYFINPYRATFSALIDTQFSDVPYYCTASELRPNATGALPYTTCPFTSGNQVISFYGVDVMPWGANVAIAIAWVLLVMLLTHLLFIFLVPRLGRR